MSAAKPEVRELWFYDRNAEKPDNCIARVQVAAARIVQVSNYADLKDKDGNTFCTLTWPSRYRVTVV